MGHVNEYNEPLMAAMKLVWGDGFMAPGGTENVQVAPQVIVSPEPLRPIVENSIAVLPFINMSAEENQEYFSDGLSEELLNVLTKVEGLWRPTARRSRRRRSRHRRR